MALSQNADFEYLMSDGSGARVDQHSPKQKSKAVGKSRGVLSTRIHGAVDSLENPVRLSAEQGSAYGQFRVLIEGITAMRS